MGTSRRGGADARERPRDRVSGRGKRRSDRGDRSEGGEDALAHWLLGRSAAFGYVADLLRVAPDEMALFRGLCAVNSVRARLGARLLWEIAQDLGGGGSTLDGEEGPRPSVTASATTPERAAPERAALERAALERATGPAAPEKETTPTATATFGAPSTTDIGLGPRPDEALREAIAQLERVTESLDALQRMIPVVTWRMGWHRGGTDAIFKGLAAVKVLADLVDRHKALVAMADLIGRVERQLDAGRPIERGGRETVVGVTLSGELPDALPSELALLGDAETEDLFYARWQERRLLSVALEGESDVAYGLTVQPGPLIVCVDTSASMGPHEELAKALVLALARRVLGQGRDLMVLLFGGRGSLRSLRLSAGRGSLEQVLKLLAISFGGGTDFDGPVGRALSLRGDASGRWKGAALLLITDGIGRLSATLRARLDTARLAGFEVHVALIGPRSASGEVATWSDRLHRLQRDGAGGLQFSLGAGGKGVVF